MVFFGRLDASMVFFLTVDGSFWAVDGFFGAVDGLPPAVLGFWPNVRGSMSLLRLQLAAALLSVKPLMYLCTDMSPPGLPWQGRPSV